MNKKGYRIAQYEQALPAGATIDEVRYHAKTGQRVNYVIGTVQVRVFHPDGILDKQVKVTWDNEVCAASMRIMYVCRTMT